MFNTSLNWVKTHKLVVLLSLVVLYLLFQSSFGGVGSSSFLKGSGGLVGMSESADSVAISNVSEKVSMQARGGTSSIAYPAPDYAPAADVTDRLIIQNSYLSLLVSNVVDVRKKIVDHAKAEGGYMVSAETTNPEDAPTSTVTVRIPSEKFDSALETYRSWGIKVVSENIIGTDVTDQYVDLDARIATLESTKIAMEEILNQATQIADLTEITREIINIQSQIDSLKGMQKSLEANADLAKMTIYLATDEIALPYAPSETFRPNVILKLAVRSLIVHARQAASLGIWLAVYSVIWVPVLVILFLLNRKYSRGIKSN